MGETSHTKNADNADNADAEAVESYLASLPEQARQRLEVIREAVAVAAPDAHESISYGILAYKLRGKPLVYFGGFASHIGMYATPVGHAEFAQEFARYKQGKGSVQLPLSEPLPLELITRVIEFRVRTLTEAS